MASRTTDWHAHWRLTLAFTALSASWIAPAVAQTPILHNGMPETVETLPPLVPRLPPPPSSEVRPATLPPLTVARPARGATPVAPAPKYLPDAAVRNVQAPTAAPGRKVVPVSLDAVLRLAQDQNGHIRLAREKLQEAHAEQELVGRRWIPDLTVGVGLWRHEGGIQDFDGRLIDSSYGSILGGLELRGKIDVREAVYARLDAERKVWQHQGELSRFTTDQLLDAGSTYVDLLTAHATVAIAIESERKLLVLLEQARNLAKVDSGVAVEVARVESELGAQRILTRRVREGAHAAAAKLAYLLDLDPHCELILADNRIIVFRLINLPASPDELVELALRSGPGVREMEGVLGILEEARNKRVSPMHLLPTFEVRMTEGAFGAGPGSRLDWENRWDLGVQARWNLTEFLSSKQRKRLADLKIQQAHLGYHDLRGRLTLGVHEAFEAQRSGQDQMALAEKQIEHAEKAYRLSEQRLQQNIKGRSPSEVLLALRALVGARLSYLQAVRDLDKAQLRLFVLTGGAAN